MDLLDDLGATVPLSGPVRRVISLVPSLTEAIAVTRPGLLIAATDWCTHPAELDVERVRGTKNPNVRRIATLAPDLVVCNEEENRRIDVERLRSAGIPVWVTRIRTLDEALAAMDRLFTVPLDGETPDWLVRAARQWAAPPPEVTRAAVVPIWRDPWMVVGRSTFTGDIARLLGLRLVHADRPQRYPTVSPDELTTGVELAVLPDEPYPFTENDGPEMFPRHSRRPGLRAQPHLVRAVPCRCPPDPDPAAGRRGPAHVTTPSTRCSVSHRSQSTIAAIVVRFAAR
ncbi:helical backbone metal receptor [Nocardia stercoris]|uniref:helical backbone metal receptor n=1 Tax=Nocardia stercoris TaxID=2483361 RepID=UPI001F45C381|nr:helical backbone metal receptor [Nocardia stercoris]